MLFNIANYKTQLSLIFKLSDLMAHINGLRIESGNDFLPCNFRVP